MTTRFPPAADPDTGGEPQVQRHLRLWTSRFNDSLMCAIIVALDLHKHPENLDKFGLVVTLRPRAHPEAGSRFSLISAEIGTLSGLMEIVVERQLLQARGADVRPNVAELHQQHRDQQRRETGGTEDYAAVMIIVQNGEDDRMDIRCVFPVVTLNARPPHLAISIDQLQTGLHLQTFGTESGESQHRLVC